MAKAKATKAPIVLTPAGAITHEEIDRVEMVGRLIDTADELIKAPVRDIDAIKAHADLLYKMGLVQASRELLKEIE